MALLDKVLNIIAPHDCLMCGREDSLLCEWCQGEACQPVPSRCYKCQKATEYSAVCANCRPKTKIKHLWVASEYQSTTKLLVHKLKFERSAQVAKIIADFLDSTVPFLTPGTIIAHIPTATERIRQRGYDQSELIAKAFAAKRGLIHTSLFRRLGQSRQVGSKKTDRNQQLASAFEPKNGYLIQKSQILLIDDVLTTGATMEQAAAVLKKAGAKEVHGAVFAQSQYQK